MKDAPEQKSYQFRLFFFLTCAASILFLWPYHNFQYWLAQGDHGRELYAFKMVWQGALPYQDFSWVFGPLLPYYFGAFFLLFGENIQAILAAQLLLVFGTSLLIYLASAQFITPVLSCAAALWYVCLRGYEFPHSYHHSGSLFFVVSIVYFLFRYIKTNQLRYVAFGYMIIFLLSLTRLNLGFANLAAFVLCLAIIDYRQNRKNVLTRWKFHFYSALCVVFATTSIYYLLLHSVADYILPQTFPYTKTNLVVSDMSIWDACIAFFKLIKLRFMINPLLQVFSALLILGVLQLLCKCFRQTISKPLQKDIFFTLGVLMTFILFNLHEYILSGVVYRIHWAFPLIMMLILFICHFKITTGPSKFYTPFVRLILTIVLFCPVTYGGSHILKDTGPYKNPDFFIDIGDNKIYSHQGSAWISAVKDTVDYINSHAAKDAKILAIPHTSLYYFLTKRESGTRQLDFFQHNSISQKQERDIIAELEQNGVDWIIVSNRVNSLEAGMGGFGATHCVLITKYIHKNFETAAEFGDLTRPGGWAHDHATRILKRKSKN